MTEDEIKEVGVITPVKELPGKEKKSTALPKGEAFPVSGLNQTQRITLKEGLKMMIQGDPLFKGLGSAQIVSFRGSCEMFTKPGGLMMLDLDLTKTFRHESDPVDPKNKVVAGYVKATWKWWIPGTNKFIEAKKEWPEAMFV